MPLNTPKELSNENIVSNIDKTAILFFCNYNDCANEYY
jgi:hypothetical protein